MNKRHCSGCHDDFYNGNNSLWIKECWMFKSAKIVWRKEVSIDQIPPWRQKAKRFPDCYHRLRFNYVDPKRTS